MINIFDNYNGITAIVNDAIAEEDRDYIDFLSSSCSSDTVIITDRNTLIKDFRKYNEIYLTIGFDDILERLKKLKNKNVFIDKYITMITITSPFSNHLSQRYKKLNFFYQKMNFYANENKLNIVIFDYKYNSFGPRMFSHQSSLFLSYDSEKSMIKCDKTRYENYSGEKFNLKNWKNQLRLKKIERIIEEK